MDVFWYAVFFLVFGTAAYAGYHGAPWVPTRKKELSALVSYLRSVPERHYGIDLGCGTGSLLFLLAQAYPRMELHGYDLSLGPLFFGWIRKWLSPKRYKNVHLHFKNLYHVDVSPADLVFVFMMPEPHTRIAKSVLRQMSPGALVFFEAWAPQGFSSFQKIETPHALPLFVYAGNVFSSQK